MNQSKLTVLLNVQLVNQIINLLMNSTNNQTQCQLEAKDVLPTQTARRPPKGPKNSVFVPGDLDLNIQARVSEEPHIFPANLAQIRSAVPEIFHTTKQVLSSS